MTRPASLSRILRSALPLAALGLGGCSTVLIDPAGDVARQQSSLILWSTALMLLIIIPVMALTVLFAWRYREGNEQAKYEPDWDHSTGLELIIWSAPLLIVIALGAMTWTGTHLLDPYRPLSRPAGAKAEAAVKPLEVQVVSLDWKWLFIYPEQGIATLNQLTLPVDRPVVFRMTSASQMNTFWVPAMAGMIYTMPGMETKLHAVLNRPGDYAGRSANYSGAGFSGMHFRTKAVSAQAFDRWVSSVRAAPGRLDAAEYIRLETPTENVPPSGFGTVDTKLYDRIVGMCVRPGTLCAMGSRGGGGPSAEGALTREPEEKGSAPHSTAPRGRPQGNQGRGQPSNRNMTLLEQPSPDTAAVARV